MNKNDIEKYLEMVGLELHQQGLTGEILLLGGAAMLIEIGNRESTNDVDGVFLSDFTAIMKAAAVVAKRESLPDGWLNSAAAGFTFNFIKQPSTKLWKSFPGLNVYIVSLEYLFATKILANRARDDADILALAKRLHITNRKDAFALLAQYVPTEDITVDIVRKVEQLFVS